MIYRIRTITLPPVQATVEAVDQIYRVVAEGKS